MRQLLISLLLLFYLRNVDPLSSELEHIRQKWNKCCKTNVCVGKSCYSLEWRTSSWAAVRQRCQGQYPDWPSSTDLFRIQREEDVKTLWNKLHEMYDYPDNRFRVPKTFWTSGAICSTVDHLGNFTVAFHWTTNFPFAHWLEQKITTSDLTYGKKNDWCKFLVISPAAEKGDIKYYFQDEYAHHGAICEFFYPGEISTDLSTEKTESDHDISSITLPNRNLSTSRNELSVTQSTVKMASTKSTIPQHLTCKSTKKSGIIWPETPAGSTVNKSCPNGMIGYAQWTCNGTTLHFMPSKPHVQDCRHIWIDNFKKYILEEQDAVGISQKLANETRQKEISHGDISAFVVLAVDLYNLFVKQNDAVPETLESQARSFLSFNFTQSMIVSFSNVLQAQVKSAWDFLPRNHQTREASKILKLVHTIGRRLSCFKNSSNTLQFTVTADNIELQTFRLDDELSESNRIVFPQEVRDVKSNSYISLPYNLPIKKLPSHCQNFKIAIGVLYKQVGRFLRTEMSSPFTEVVSSIISFSLSNSDSISLPEGFEVSIVLQHDIEAFSKKNWENPRCVFWNFSKQLYGEWDDSGCNLVSSNKSHTKCKCNHLTNFAVLMDVNNNMKEDVILSMMTFVCCGVSSFTLALTILCFFSIRSLHNKRSIITGNLCFCLLIANLLILFGLDKTEKKTVCSIVAGLLHFWLLSAFFWMLVEGYHLYQMVILILNRGLRIPMKYYYLFAYGCPLIIVAFSLGLQSEGYGGIKYCWISTTKNLIWSFVGPACAVMIVNVVIFVLALHSASNVQIKKEQCKTRKIRSWIRGSMSVLCLLGITWCIGLFYIDEKLRDFSYVFTLLNGLQGVFIFCFHVLLNDKITTTIFNNFKKNALRRQKFSNHTSKRHLPSQTSSRNSTRSTGVGSMNTKVDSKPYSCSTDSRDKISKYNVHNGLKDIKCNKNRY